jgi:hypothetical protein
MSSLSACLVWFMFAQAAAAFMVGLAFFYLRATMTNPLFEFIAATLAFLLAIAAIMLGAFTDWVEACLSKTTNRHESLSFLLLGGLMATAAAYLAFAHGDFWRVLLLFAALHGCIFGSWSLLTAPRVGHTGAGIAVSLLLGLGSLLFAAGFLWTGPLDGHRAVMLLGAYSCFVGLKLGYRALQMAFSCAHQEPAPKVRFV